MTKTRLLHPAPKKPGACSLQEWNRLLRTAIQMAEKSGSIRRLRALRAALQQGKAKECLKRLSVISEGDLQREFGLK